MSEKPKVPAIDDDADLVDSVRMVMGNAGWRVSSAGNGATGTTRARETGYGHAPEAFLEEPCEPHGFPNAVKRVCRPHSPAQSPVELSRPALVGLLI